MSPSEEADLLRVNLAFYQSFESMDYDAMAALWSQRPEDICVHPGWPFLAGWRDIRESWRAIFANTGFMRIDITDVRVELGERLARVCCVENLYSVFDQQTLASQVAATNLFIKVDGAWKVTLHHGSPVASQEVAPADPGDEN